MTPHSLTTIKVTSGKKSRFPAGSLEAKFGEFAKGAAVPNSQSLACPRVKVADLPDDFLKKRHIEALEHNQKIASCCRHPEDHEVEAFKSNPDEPAPDIYVFHCGCGRKHRFFCVGGTDEGRPMWSVD